MSTEIIGLTPSIAYAQRLAAEARQHSPDGNENYPAQLAAARVTAAALTTGHDMQAAFATAAAAATRHAAELSKQTTVQEQYNANPDAGDKTFQTGARGDVLAVDPDEQKGSRVDDHDTGPPNPDNAIRIDGGDDLDVVVTPYANGTVRIDLADNPEHGAGQGPHVILDEAAVAALADAGATMQAAEKTGRDAYQKLDTTIRRLERRHEQIEQQRSGDRGAELIAMEKEFEDLSSRAQRLWARMRERLDLLNTADRAAFDALNAQLADGGDRRAIRASQDQIVFGMSSAEIDELHAPGTTPQRRRELRNRPGGMPDGSFGRRTLHLRDQQEWDKIADRKAELRRQAQAIPQVPLSPQAEAELERIKTDIAAAQNTITDMTDWQELAAGVIPTPDGSGLAWQTVMVDDGRTRHQLDRRPADAHEQWYIGCEQDTPSLTTRQLHQLITAITSRSSPMPPGATNADR